MAGARRRPFRLAVLGGTFDRLHAGHRRLIARAFARAEAIRIGLTTPAYLRAHPKPWPELLEPYRRRREALLRHLQGRYARRDWRVLPLNDPFGRSVELGPDLLVVSAETVRGARAVNRRRRALGRPVLAVEVVRMRRDRHGRILRSRHRREALGRAGMSAKG